MKYRSFISIITAAILALGVTACGSSTNTATPAKTNETPKISETKTETTEASAIDTSKFVDVVWYSLGDIPTNGQLEAVKAKWDVVLKDKVNASLTFKFIPWTDWSTQYNLKLASGESFDMINAATDWLSAWQNAQRGAFMNLDELLPVYAPITWSEVPQTDWDQCKYNDKIVIIPEDQFTQWVNHGFFYRGDWAKEFSLPDPIRSWTDIGKYLQGVKDNKPGVVPFDVAGNAGTGAAYYNGFMTSNTDWVVAEPIHGDAYFIKDYNNPTEIISPVFEDIMLDYAIMMKDWADKGYWREDVLNYTGDNREALKAGKSGMDEHHTQTYSGLRVDMDEKQPGSELQMFPFALQGGNNLTEMTITHGGMAIPASSKNAERSLMIYDLVRNDPEMYRYVNYGIEGVQYVIKDGMRTQPEGYDKTRDEFYTDFWGGRMDSLEIPTDRTYAKIGDLYAQYDAVKKPFAFPGFVWDPTAVASEISTVDGVFNSTIASIAFGKAGDPTAAVEKFRTDLKNAGIDKVIAEANRQLSEWHSKK